MNSPYEAFDQPIVTDRFQVKFETLPELSLRACRGLGAKKKFLTLDEGGTNSPRYFEMGTSYDPLVLEALLPPSSPYWEWIEQGDPKSGKLIAFDANDRMKGLWEIKRARPSRWRSQDFDSTLRQPVLTQIELLHEGLNWMREVEDSPS